MKSKFDKVMQNLQDSLDTSITIEGIEWCQVKKKELIALKECAHACEHQMAVDPDGVPHSLSALYSIEQCADE